MADPMRKTDRHYRYRNYREWPDSERWELIDGAAWNMSPAPTTLHQRVLQQLNTAFLRAAHGTPCEVLFAPLDVFPFTDDEAGIDDADTVVQPDLIVACDPTRLVRRGHLGPPALVVEVLSTWTLRKDLTDKLRVYERAGVAEYWIVNPGDQSIMIYRIQSDGSYPVEPAIVQEPSVARSTVLDALEVRLPLGG